MLITSSVLVEASGKKNRPRIFKFLRGIGFICVCVCVCVCVLRFHKRCWRLFEISSSERGRGGTGGEEEAGKMEKDDNAERMVVAQYFKPTENPRLYRSLAYFRAGSMNAQSHGNHHESGVHVARLSTTVFHHLRSRELPRTYEGFVYLRICQLK